MTISLFISRFIYRIRYQLLFGSIIVTCLVAYFSQFLPKNYTVKTSIYTGIISGSSISENENTSFQIVNNTFDNLINLVTAQSTLDNVALNLFAMNLINGDPKKDNEYITAKNFIELQEDVPDEIKRLIDKNSVEKSVENLKKFNKNSGNKFLYVLLNGNNRHYSYSALESVRIKRLSNSDMIEMSYTSDDPGITHNTVKLFNNALLDSYNDLRYNSTNDVIAYFEAEVAKFKSQLGQKEDALTDYNVKNNVINYIEQTKAIAISFTNYEDRVEETERLYNSAEKSLKVMEKHMETRSKLYYTNKNFLSALDSISTINGHITEIEMFTAVEAQEKNQELKNYKKQLKNAEASIARLSTDMDMYKYTKDGLAIQELSNEWIKSLIEKTKIEAQLNTLKARRKEFEEHYRRFSPVGTEMKRKEREITVTENSYLEVLHALNLAYLRKKNIQLTTANLNTISEPTFPLSPNKSKRMLIIIAAFFGSLIFITLYKMLVEILDRTIRDGERAKRLIGVTPIGAFIGRSELRYRGYSKTWNRIAATSICGKINNHLKPKEVSYINILSIEKGEGKSYTTKYLVEDWERQGLNVKIVVLDNNIIEQSSYVLATDFSDIIPESEVMGYDLVLIEYPSLHSNSVPKSLLEKAAANILIINAKRVWKTSDAQLFSHLKSLKTDDPCLIILNNATRYDVEDFTSELPPSKSYHSFAMRLMHMGLTSKKSSI